jgi:hypothetical protein
MEAGVKKLGVSIVPSISRPSLGGHFRKIAPWELSEQARRDIAEIEHNARTAVASINASGWPYCIAQPLDPKDQ